MSKFRPQVELTPPGRRFVRLAARGPGPQGSVGCMFALGIPLTLLGAGAAAVPFVSAEPIGESFVAALVGTAFGLVGLLLVWGGIRGARARSLPPPELELEQDEQLRPGGSLAVRVRQPGPVALESLKLVLTCERRYRRKVKRGSSRTVDDAQLLWQRELLTVRDQRIAVGERWERMVGIELPADALPTGSAEPDGRVRWTLELSIEAGFLRGWRTDFEIEVGAR